MQEQSPEELCNLLIQSLVAKDEKLMRKVLEQEDESVIKNVIDKIPASHVRKLVIELSNLLSNKLTPNHLTWLQHILASKYSVISSMADGRSILLPLQSLLEDKSLPAYYSKVQALKGKLTLLKQLRETRKSEGAETVVRVPHESDQTALMELDAQTDTESEGASNDELENEEGNYENEEDVPPARQELEDDEDYHDRKVDEINDHVSEQSDDDL